MYRLNFIIKNFNIQIQILPVWAAMFAISGYRSLLQSFEDSFLELMTAENSNITVGILTLSVAIPEIQVFPEYKYFRFGRPYCYFRLSVVVAIIWGHFLWTRHGRKTPNCRWNFDAIYHSSRDISTSGLGGHITISGCQSLSQSLSLNSTWSKPQIYHWKRTHLLFYSNSLGCFYPKRNRCA